MTLTPGPGRYALDRGIQKNPGAAVAAPGDEAPKPRHDAATFAEAQAATLKTLLYCARSLAMGFRSWPLPLNGMVMGALKAGDVGQVQQQHTHEFRPDGGRFQLTTANSVMDDPVQHVGDEGAGQRISGRASTATIVRDGVGMTAEVFRLEGAVRVA